MPALLQIWIVIVTIGLLAIALLALRMMNRFLDRTSVDISKLSHAVHESASQIDLGTQEARMLVASLRECVPPVMRVVERLEAVGQRTAALSSTVLEEVERPIFTAAAVARGVRSGANYFLRRLMYRFIHRSSPFLGGNDHE